MAYRLALFDFDGVLADSADWFIGQLPDLARRHRFRAPAPSEIERLRRLPTRDVVKALGVSPLRLPGIAADLRKRMAADARRITLFDGVPDMLRRLHDRGVRVAVVASNSEPNVRAVLGAHASLVSAYSCGASLFGKSARFSALLRRLDLEPSQACAVGDEVRDIEAAHQAGISAVAVAWGYGAAEALAAAVPDYVARSPADVAAFLLG
jgi:phosphoglycolate phosphatase